MNSSVAYLFAIIFIVIALNFYFLIFRRMKRDKPKKLGRAAVDEAKQAIWREKEVARRLEREQDDAMEVIKLRNETLAMYEEVRRRHAKDDELERLASNPNLIDDRPIRPDPEPDSYDVDKPDHTGRGADSFGSGRAWIDDIDPFDMPGDDDRR